MKTQFLIINFVLCFLFGITLNAQNKVVYEDNFLTNTGWAEADNENAYLKVINGKYIFQYKKTTGWWATWRSVEIDTKQDFQITCNTLWHSGVENYVYEIIWGLADVDNYFAFGITANGYYRYRMRLLGEEKTLIDWTSSSFINNKGSNDIKIIKRDNKIEFYINNQKINEYQFTDFYGNKIGFCIFNNQKILFDDLKVEYLSNFTNSNKNENIVFLDDFSNNNNLWAESEDENTLFKVMSGKYIFEHKRTSGWWASWKTIEFDSKKDFSISCNTFWLSGIDNHAYEIIWGLSDVDNYYAFGITANGYYRYRMRFLGEDKILIDWTKSDLISKNGSNEIWIQKRGKNYEFFINSKKVDEYKFDDFFGTRLGFCVNNNQKILFDDLKIAYIENTNIYDNYVPTVVSTDKRVALVIGNADYTNGQPLKNPVNDAVLMSNTLKEMGFEVILRTNANKSTMEQSVREFSKKLPYCNVALFYYAGHGVQVEGINYIIPIDAQLNTKEDCKYEAMSVNFIVEEFDKFPNNINIVILDACRNNPFRSWVRGNERGFVAIPPSSGTIISYATSEGAVALDGTGTNGLFTQELVKQMQIHQPIENVFKKTRVEVEKISNGFQSPQEWSKLKGDFFFK